jgi:hypothetical protein
VNRALADNLDSLYTNGKSDLDQENGSKAIWTSNGNADPNRALTHNLDSPRAEL